MAVLGGSVKECRAIRCSGRDIRPSLDQHVEALKMSTLRCSHDCASIVISILDASQEWPQGQQTTQYCSSSQCSSCHQRMQAEPPGESAD
eukprot:m.167798 g.167798  ORF g.167798 m.167798 type:complete len:90 (-) comp53182_c0_seq10:63-332(-)